jgi:hypothetical protein
MRIDPCIDDALHQEPNVKSATDPSDSKRDSSQADRPGQSNPIAEKGYIDVTQLSTCEPVVLRNAFFHLEPPKASSSMLHGTTQPAHLQQFPDSLRNWSSKSVPNSSMVPILIPSRVLEDRRNSDLIAWSEDGSSFIIHTSKRICCQVSAHTKRIRIFYVFSGIMISSSNNRHQR